MNNGGGGVFRDGCLAYRSPSGNPKRRKKKHRQNRNECNSGVTRFNYFVISVKKKKKPIDLCNLNNILWVG